ncbi:Response regulatory domain-containing protein [Heracleum sosnowskyi]|uniref:Response regulatory domain-containing protein n=1 Tax=Heracleum sosnowskyi TaxID=360622 RepID=A0AAD8M9L4_9APIA|nr:Response regulatory domain-containing protein [Heracleum sosnowskyi]
MASQGGRSHLNNINATRRATALVVDDDHTCRVVMALTLKWHGFETCQVESAKEAIDLFRDGREFDVVLMDIHMPDKSGPQATRELREMGVTSMIIGVEAQFPSLDAQEFIDAGMDRFYEKPLESLSVALLHQELMNMINNQ